MTSPTSFHSESPDHSSYGVSVSSRRPGSEATPGKSRDSRFCRSRKLVSVLKSDGLEGTGRGQLMYRGTSSDEYSEELDCKESEGQ